MRRFSSYGPVNTENNYYAPRKELINRALTLLTGENYSQGGNFVTVWAPRQTGKTWIMQEILFQLKNDPRFDVIKINLECLKNETKTEAIINYLSEEIGEKLNKNLTGINSQQKFQKIFKRDVLEKPLILLLDEFDSLCEQGINTIVSVFRNIHISRMDERDKSTEQKTYLLHSVALIGVRNVLGIENDKGSPFNVQRSLHIPNLSFEEVKEMFQWYQRESRQDIEPPVIETLYKETKGQPGLTCWFGEILTEGFEGNPNDLTKPIRLKDFEEIYRFASNNLPNNNILNIISKAKVSPYRDIVINLFKTDKPMKFRFDDKDMNYLYMNGVIEPESILGDDSYVKFASPFVQKRLFNYFSGEIFKDMGQLVENFLDAKEFITADRIDIPTIMSLYQAYLLKNKHWLFKNAQRRSDLRIYEAVFHFNLYAYLDELLRGKKVRISPEFPTGNGKIDLLIHYNNDTYGLELKSFSDKSAYKEALEQAAQYSSRLNLREIYLISFIENIDEESKKIYQTPYRSSSTSVIVTPIFIQTGSV